MKKIIDIDEKNKKESGRLAIDINNEDLRALIISGDSFGTVWTMLMMLLQEVYMVSDISKEEVLEMVEFAIDDIYNAEEDDEDENNCPHKIVSGCIEGEDAKKIAEMLFNVINKKGKHSKESEDK